MELRRSFDQYQEADRSALRAAARQDWLIWLITSLGAGLIPFAVVAIVYRAGFETPHHHHSFPPLSMLFGGGELLLVILSVTGATLAEIWLNPDHLRSLPKSTALAASVLIAFAAGGLFTAITYAGMVGKEAEIDSSFVAVLSAVLLSLVVIIQSITLLTRQHNH